MIATLVYSLLFTLTILAALLVVFSRHAIYCAIYLIVAMVSIAGLFLMIDAQLAAVLQVLVYAGAIMVLFLFVIMLLNLGRDAKPPADTRFVRRVGFVLFIVFLLQVAILTTRFSIGIELDPDALGAIEVADVSLSLLTEYIFAFEMTSVMLLIAVVGSMVLARRSIGLESPNRPEDAG